MERTPELLIDGGHYFEAPRWRDGLWWVSDFYAHQVMTITPGGDKTVIMEVPGRPSGLGWLPDGSLLVVSMTDGKVLRRAADGTTSVHADISAYIGGVANDMIVDGNGRAWVGNFGFDLMGGGTPSTTVLVRVDPDGTVSVAAEDLYFPNGSMLLDGGKTLVVNETIGNRVSAFAINADGSLGERRNWATFGDLPPLDSFDATLGSLVVGPDGGDVDSDGHLWIADAIGGRVVRVAPNDGGIVDEIAAPDGLGTFACALGGPAGTTLLMCCAPDFFEHERVAKTEAALYSVQLA